MKRVLLVVIAVIVVLLVAAYWLTGFGRNMVKAPTVREVPTSFEDCVAQGNPVMESYPPQCRTKEGQVFVQDIGNEIELNDLIRVTFPRPNDVVNSPIRIEGEARGQWYFEADFPARLFDSQGREIGVGIMAAQGEWMTEEFVPFSGEVVFSETQDERGVLVLEKANPSGLPENEEQLRIPVLFR